MDDLFAAIERSRKIVKHLRQNHGDAVIITHRLIDYMVLTELRAYLERQAHGKVTVLYGGA